MSNILNNLQNKGLLSEEDAKPYDPVDYSFTDADGQVGEWIDADTIKIGGKSVRLSGYDSEEVAKRGPDGSFKAGEVGGAEQRKAVAALARTQGYNRLVLLGEGQGGYGRDLYDLQNAAGDSWSNRLTAEGIVNPRAGDYFTTQQDLQDKAWAQLFREANTARQQGTAFNEAADWIDQVFEEQGLARGLKKTVQDEAELASWKEAAKHDPLAREYYNNALHHDQVQIRNPDRDLENKARNPLSVAWDQGLNGVVEGGAGLLQLVGQETGWQGLEDYATGKIQLSHDDIAKMPSIIVDYKDIDDTGDFLEYVGNMAAMSLPYMALSLGAAGVGAVAGTTAGAIALTAPAGVYAGQTWNEMEGEKNAGLAIASGVAQAMLDRLGINFITGNQAVSAGGRKAIVDHLVNVKGMTINEAKAAVVNQTRRAAAELSADAVTFAQDQLKKREILKQFITRTGQGVASEGSTEVMQELTAYLSAVAGSDKTFDAGELQDRLTNAAIGGGVLGGAFSVPSTAYNTGAWLDVARKLEPANDSLRAKQNVWAEEEAAASDGELPDHTAILRSARDRAGRGQRTALSTRVDADKERKRDRTWGETGTELFGSLPGLWRGATRHIFNEDLQDNSVTARRLASLFGGQLYQMYAGPTFENAKHLALARYKSLMKMPFTYAERMGFSSDTFGTGRALENASDIIYRAYNMVGTDFDRLKGTDLEEHIPVLKEFAADAARLTDEAYADQRNAGADIEKLQDYAFRHRALDKRKIEKDRAGFEKDLKDRFGVGAAEARQLADAVLDVTSVNSIDEAYSVLEKGGFKPSSHKKRTLGLSDDKVFQEKWLSDNIFHNLDAIAKTASRYTAYQQFLGDKNGVLETMLDEMEQELIQSGMSEEQAKAATNKAARGMQDYIDAESGNYHRPTTEFGKRLAQWQKHATFITTIGALPLATISSFVELALTARGLEQGQLKFLWKAAGEEAKRLNKIVASDKQLDTKGAQLAHQTGLFETEIGAASRAGVKEQTERQRAFTDWFFRAIKLKQWTDMTRMMRASMAFDFILGKIDVIEQAQGEVTNEVAAARDALRNLGLDPNRLDEIALKIEEHGTNPGEPAPELLNAVFNFVNDAVVYPNAANRPLFYQDPRFALFTQFQGFISTFQATVLPKLYREAFKGQTPSMKYNAFAIITTMIVLGFLSQHLKDLIKHGKSSPYLTEDGQKLQRAINSSGLLGTGERLLNIANPLYESRYDNTAEWAFDTALGESAAAGFAQKGTDAITSFLGGDAERGVKQALKITPFVAPLNSTRNYITDWAFDEE